MNQDYCLDCMEILIADGISTDGTTELLDAYKRKYDNLRVFINPVGIVPTGMNLLIQKSKGDIIIRIDGHTTVERDYVRKCVEVLKKTNADNVGGKMDPKGETIFGEAVALATCSRFGIGNARFHYSDKEEHVDTVYMGAWPREVFKKIGLFDEELVRDQDDEFNYRIRKASGRIILSPEIKSKYIVRSTPNSLWKQYFQYGFWKIRVFQKHPRQMGIRQFIPPLFILSLLGTLTASLIFHWGWIILVGLLGSYTLVSLVTSFKISKGKDWQLVLQLLLCFAIIHFSYGIGFWFGLFKFIRRWNDKEGKVPEVPID